MKVVITGGAGFLGKKLARRVLQQGSMAGPDGKPERVSELLLFDVGKASGPGLAVGVGTPEAIPSLASLPRDRFPSEVIRKVREGLAKPTPMMTSNRGQMPIFSSLKPEEVAAAYAYLVRYPPRP